MKIALDSNVLAYAEVTIGTAMRDKALELISGCRQSPSCSRFRRWVSCSTFSSDKPSGDQGGRGQP